MKQIVYFLFLLILAQQAMAQPKTSRAEQRAAYWGQFLAFGYEGGTIPPYGIRAESGRSDRFIGAFLSFRTSMRFASQLEKYTKENFPANKSEFVGGISLRLDHQLYLNVGAGIGEHYYPFYNEYNRSQSLEKKNYLPGYLGATFRLTRRLNLIGGMSYIAFTERLYAPEYTFGFTINVK